MRKYPQLYRSLSPLRCAASESTACAGLRSFKRTNKDVLLKIMRSVNILNGLLLVLACVFAFTIIAGSVTRFFLAIYIGCVALSPVPALRHCSGPPPACTTLYSGSLCTCSVFSLMLLAFELRIKKGEVFMKRWFGFMFTYSGRTGFLMLYVIALIVHV